MDGLGVIVVVAFVAVAAVVVVFVVDVVPAAAAAAAEKLSLVVAGVPSSCFCLFLVVEMECLNDSCHFAQRKSHDCPHYCSVEIVSGLVSLPVFHVVDLRSHGEVLPTILGEFLPPH